MPHIRIGSIPVRAFDRNSETVTLSIEEMKARKHPGAIPGAINGKVIRRKP